MAITYKILGQTAPTSTANVDLLTVGSGKSVAISTINMSNHTAASATYRIFVRIAGASAGTANEISYDIPVAAKSKIAETLGITLAATDVVTVQCDPANSITFTAFGQENS